MNAKKLNPLLALVLGLLTLIGTLALLGMLPGLSPVQADPIWYVDGAGGADDSSCGALTASCETISYTLNTLASSGNIIRVAQGTYLENLTIDIMRVVNTAGNRAIMIGIALGTASVSLRILLGVDRSHLGSGDG